MVMSSVKKEYSKERKDTDLVFNKRPEGGERMKPTDIWRQCYNRESKSFQDTRTYSRKSKGASVGE